MNTPIKLALGVLLAAALTPAVMASSYATYESTIWSGYVVTGGPFKEATGDFTIPSLRPASVLSSVAEWVGVGGIGDPALIQAGVNLFMEPDGEEFIEPFWVASATDYTAQAIPLSVQTGDTLTAEVQEVSPSEWSLSLSDDNTGAAWETEQPFSSVGDTAEWVVEDTGLPAAPYAPYPLEGFSPVHFSQLTTNGKIAGWQRWTLVQNGTQLDTVSPVGPAGFTVSYG